MKPDKARIEAAIKLAQEYYTRLYGECGRKRPRDDMGRHEKRRLFDKAYEGELIVKAARAELAKLP